MEQMDALDVEYVAGTTRPAGVFRREKGRRRRRRIGYEIPKRQEKVVDDIEESLSDVIRELWILDVAEDLANRL
jgi:hypothetical protein